MLASPPPVAGPRAGHIVRSVTPPRIVSHKPPKPTVPPPEGSVLRTPPSVQLTFQSATPLGATAPTKSPGRGRSAGDLGALPQLGYMIKEGAVASLMAMGKKTWKRRYFALEASTLTYYENETMYSSGHGSMKGTEIDVRQHFLLQGGTDGVDITLQPAGGGDRAWRFRCENEADVKIWVAALTAHGARRK